MVEIDTMRTVVPRLLMMLNLVKKKLTVEMRRVVEIAEILEMRMMIPCPCQFVQEKSLVLIYKVFPHFGKYAKKSLDSPLPIHRLLRWHMTKSDNIVEGDPFKYKGRSTEIVHPYLIPTALKDTIIDVLKANLKGVIILTSAEENNEDEILAVDKDYTTPTIDNDGATVDVDETLPLAIIDEDLVAVDEYFAEEVNEVVEEMKEGKKEQEEEKMEEKEEKKEEEEIKEKKEEKKRRSRKKIKKKKRRSK
ncbi:hypothetical protein H5410_015989 [Solanum commersonii]|uniref:Uncharacterized protein n=1 Tax=Solanum commersonii TaxID=4109 RepID=A0A9J5ZV12_SOLCO|nr:hypothetical protein H5410_015989 [Solanum commersonii]